MQVKRFGVSLEEELLNDLDKLVIQQNFPNRSQAIRYLIKRNLVEHEWDGNEDVAGAIVLVYDHHKRGLQNKSTEVQHDFHHLILSVQHVHLNHDNCLETITVSNQLISIKGIKNGQLVMSTAK